MLIDKNEVSSSLVGNSNIWVQINISTIGFGCFYPDFGAREVVRNSCDTRVNSKAIQFTVLKRDVDDYN